MFGPSVFSLCCGRSFRIGVRQLPLLLLLAACARGPSLPPPTPQPLRGAGSAVMAGLWPALASAFGQRLSGQSLSYEAIGSNLALDELAAGKWDFAINADPTAAKRHPQLSFTPVASGSVAIVVHPRTRLTNLNRTQARDLFGGFVQDWSQLGAGGGRVQLVSREDGSGARAAFLSIVMGDRPLALTTLLLPGDAEVVDYVARHPGAVGFANTNAVRAGPVAVIALDDLLPGEDGYPLVRPIDFVLPSAPAPAALALRDFLLSGAGQSLLEIR